MMYICAKKALLLSCSSKFTWIPLFHNTRTCSSSSLSISRHAVAAAPLLRVFRALPEYPARMETMAHPDTLVRLLIFDLYLCSLSLQAVTDLPAPRARLRLTSTGASSVPTPSPDHPDSPDRRDPREPPARPVPQAAPRTPDLPVPAARRVRQDPRAPRATAARPGHPATSTRCQAPRARQALLGVPAHRAPTALPVPRAPRATMVCPETLGMQGDREDPVCRVPPATRAPPVRPATRAAATTARRRAPRPGIRESCVLFIVPLVLVLLSVVINEVLINTRVFSSKEAFRKKWSLVFLLDFQLTRLSGRRNSIRNKI